ncbi:MAG: TIGR00282 family metallophosphoesterase [bacterium]
MKEVVRFIFLGDIIGEPGLELFKKWAPILKEKYKADALVVNGENASKNGNGLSPHEIEILKTYGATVITTGNHAWDCKSVYNLLEERDDVLRPLNYPSGCPGKGFCLFQVHNYTVAVVNLHGRVFVKDLIDCPFKAIESLLLFLKHKTNIIFIDFHAEATSEKKAMGLFLDGKVSGVYGTHTHVQTTDETILPGGTSFITDLGNCGAVNSVIGFEFEGVIRRLTIHHKFGKFVVEKNGPMEVSGLYVEVDAKTGKSVKVERIRVIDNDLAKLFLKDTMAK